MSMDITTEANAFKTQLAQVTNIVILLPEIASRDGIAGALALYLSLIQLEKNVTIIYPKPPIVGWSHLVGINKLTQQLGNKNFVISLDYIEGSIEKVSYNIEGDKFNLVIEPRAGAPLFNEKNVTYSHSGFATDLIIVVNASAFELLGKYYTENKQLFEEKPVVVIDNKPGRAAIGTVNLVRPSASISEIITQLIERVQLPIDSDIASNLYDGIVTGSRTFSAAAVDADTFTAAAYLLGQGARRSISIPQQEETPKRETATTRAPDVPQAPAEWLKPKIYKGSTLL